MSIKHNKVRDFTAELLSECCNNLNRACVTTTSRLKLYQRQEFSQMKFMSMLQGQVAYVSVRVLNPRARVYLTQSLNTAPSKNEKTKKRAYNRRVNSIYQRNFTPFVFTCFEDISHGCSTFDPQFQNRLLKKEIYQLRKSRLG